VLTKELEALLTVVRDGIAATVEAQRILKNSDTQGRNFMVVHTSRNPITGEGEKRK
jgi:hypothetical protein